MKYNTLFITISGWVSKATTSIVQIFLIRFLLETLHLEFYSVFVFITSLSGWFLLADFGIGYSLQNFVTEMNSKKQSIASYMAMAFTVIFVLFFILLGLLFIFDSQISKLFSGFAFLQDQEKRSLIKLAGLIFLLTGTTSISYRVFFAKHQGYIANLLPAVGSLLGLFSTYFVIESNLTLYNKLFFCVLAYHGSMAIFPFGSFLYFLKDLRIREIDFTLAYPFFRRAGIFFLNAIAGSLVLQVDYFIISKNLTPQDMANYNVISKIFMSFFVLYSTYISAIWPTVTHKHTQALKNEIKYVLKNSLFIGVLGVLLFGGFVLLTKNYLAHFFSKSGSVWISSNLVLIMVLYYLIRVWSDTTGMILMATNNMRILIYCVPAQGLISILAQYYLSQIYGLNGIVLGLVLSFVLTTVWLVPLYLYKKVLQ